MSDEERTRWEARLARERAARQEAVCAAMRAKVVPAIDSLLKDAQLAPCLAEASFHNAVLTLALAGVQALQATAKHPMYSTSKTRKVRHAQHVHHH